MSVDRSLKMRDALSRHRNVLTRAERLELLIEEERFDKDKDCPFGLPKVLHRKSHAGRKEKKAAEAAAAAEVEGAAVAEAETPADS